MERQITDFTDWVEIETHMGTWFVPAMDVSQETLDSTVYDELSDEAKIELLQFTECFGRDDVESAEVISGYGARLSAPGYMDCTEWSVFDTKAAAEAYLDEFYGDEN